MNYATGRAFRQALERRLRQQSLQAATPLVRLRKLVAFDRFLARLARAQPDTWILKGGLALQLRLAEKARLTKDVDLLLCQPLAEALTLLRRAASVDLGDWFAFEIAEATPAPEHTQGTVRRFPVHSLRDGRTPSRTSMSTSAWAIPWSMPQTCWSCRRFWPSLASKRRRSPPTR